jgi:acetolactate synthase-1/2/3 large subunit
VQEECDTMIVLMNDQRYGVIQNIQDASYGGRRCYVELHTPTTPSCARPSSCPMPA